MIYIGAGAGMAPLRAHLSHLLENERTARKISFWYGARSRQEIFYDDYFSNLAQVHRNFAFFALSAPLPDDNWAGHVDFIHDLVWENLLNEHSHPRQPSFTCGPHDDQGLHEDADRIERAPTADCV